MNVMDMYADIGVVNRNCNISSSMEKEKSVSNMNSENCLKSLKTQCSDERAMVIDDNNCNDSIMLCSSKQNASGCDEAMCSNAAEIDSDNQNCNEVSSVEKESKEKAVINMHYQNSLENTALQNVSLVSTNQDSNKLISGLKTLEIEMKQKSEVPQSNRCDEAICSNSDRPVTDVNNVSSFKQKRIIKPTNKNFPANETSSGVIVKRRNKFTLPKIILPLEKGWRREIVHRQIGKGIDIYYHPPKGKKLRSLVEVQNYLSENSITEFTLENFTYCRYAFGFPPPFETIRNANLRKVQPNLLKKNNVNNEESLHNLIASKKPTVESPRKKAVYKTTFHPKTPSEPGIEVGKSDKFNIVFPKKRRKVSTESVTDGKTNNLKESSTIFPAKLYTEIVPTPSDSSENSKQQTARKQTEVSTIIPSNLSTRISPPTSTTLGMSGQQMARKGTGKKSKLSHALRNSSISSIPMTSPLKDPIPPVHLPDYLSEGPKTPQKRDLVSEILVNLVDSDCSDETVRDEATINDSNLKFSGNPKSVEVPNPTQKSPSHENTKRNSIRVRSMRELCSTPNRTREEPSSFSNNDVPFNSDASTYPIIFNNNFQQQIFNNINISFYPNPPTASSSTRNVGCVNPTLISREQNGSVRQLNYSLDPIQSTFDTGFKNLSSFSSKEYYASPNEPSFTNDNSLDNSLPVISNVFSLSSEASDTQDVNFQKTVSNISKPSETYFEDQRGGFPLTLSSVKIWPVNQLKQSNHLYAIVNLGLIPGFSFLLQKNKEYAILIRKLFRIGTVESVLVKSRGAFRFIPAMGQVLFSCPYTFDKICNSSLTLIAFKMKESNLQYLMEDTLTEMDLTLIPSIFKNIHR